MPTDPAATRAGWTIPVDLLTLADTWATVTDPTAAPAFATRCADETCGQLICPPDRSGRLQHLMNSHGYRMDGRAYDNHNNVTTTAARELAARADR